MVSENGKEISPSRFFNPTEQRTLASLLCLDSINIR